MIKVPDDPHVKFRIGAYVTVVGWYLIAYAALLGWAYWQVLPLPRICNDCGFFASVFLVEVGVPSVVWVVTGAATGCALVGRWMARTEPTTLFRSFRLGSAVAGMGSLIGLAGLATLCTLAVGVAFVLRLLHLLG